MQLTRMSFLFYAMIGLTAQASADQLVYERFENEAIGTAHGLTFSSDVVGHAGIDLDNKFSAVFDGGVETCVDHGTATQIDGVDFTVEAFVKISRGWVHQAIAADWSEQDDQRSWAFMITPDRALRFDVSPDGAFHAGNKLLTPVRLIQDGQWYHVAAVSRGNTSRIYINGRKVAEGARQFEGIHTGDTANLKIGNVDGYASGSPQPLFGQLDEVRITSSALEPAEFIQTRDPMPEAAGPTPDTFDLPFVATSKEEAIRWQESARRRLLALVEAQEPRRSEQESPIDLKLGPPQDHQEYTLHEITFQGNQPDKRYTAKLCIPKGEGPFPAMLCLHGHGGSAEALMDSAGIYHGFADHFSRRGYVVLAPSFPHRQYAAETLWNLFRCVDILAARAEVDGDRIGVGGLSMGGEWTMWIAACDPRLKVAVVSGWMCTTEGVFSVPNCACWELPGFVGLMDVCEVNLLIAPRTAVFESATRDGCFPVDYTKRGFARIQAGYKIFGAEKAAIHNVFPGVHEWHGQIAFGVVDRVLGGRAADEVIPVRSKNSAEP